MAGLGERIKSFLTSKPIEPEREAWPEGVPLTRENLLKVAETHHIYLEGCDSPIDFNDADEKDWNPTQYDRLPENQLPHDEERAKVRQLVRLQPNAKRALALYGVYVLSGFTCRLVPRSPKQTDQEKDVMRQSELAVAEFHRANFKHWNIREWARRVYRDGEVFTRRFQKPDAIEWPPQVRFIDPENIRKDGRETLGIVTAEDDVANVKAYLRWSFADGKVVETIPAEQIFHAKCDVDSTEKRGRSRFASVIETTQNLKAMLRNEINLRNAQSSIVLVRKVAGGSSAVNRLVDNAKTSATDYREGSMSREKLRPGSVITTGKGVEIEFAQPNNNFSDASPLVKLLIQQICAATGWSYTMVSADASDNNAAAGAIAEMPVVQMVSDEREFVEMSVYEVYAWVMESAAEAGRIAGVKKADIWTNYILDFRFNDIVSREPLKEAQAVNIGVMTQALSRLEASRRLKADPDQMRAEVEAESKLEFLSAGQNGQSMNPDMADKQSSSASNTQKGKGTNQG